MSLAELLVVGEVRITRIVSPLDPLLRRLLKRGVMLGRSELAMVEIMVDLVRSSNG